MVNQLQNLFGNVKLKTVSLSAISLFFLYSCQPSEKNIQWHGEAQGTTYSIILPRLQVEVEQSEIDSILKDFDKSLSTYNPTSTITKLNAASTSFEIPESDSYFLPCYQLSQKYYKLTEGAFDPSVFPLVKAWGFFKDMENIPSKEEVDSILKFVNFESGSLHEIKGRTFTKKDSRFCLDFNAIAQGYSVDVVADYLDQKGVKEYYIEIGGELRLKGKNPDGNDWRIGVDVPKDDSNEENREINAILNVSNVGLASSGNYRKFYIKNGKKYAHTLNPKTGFPEENSLLSATVLSPTSAESDALATAFMVMGLEKSKKFLQANKMVRAYLIYQDENGKITEYVSPKLKIDLK